MEVESLSILSNPVVNAVDFARLTERERERKIIDLTASLLVFADVRVTGQRCKHSIFPSKIIAYMSCGLQCVSVAMKVIEKSTFSEFIIQYEGDDLQEIAATIMSAKRHLKQETRDVVKRLDQQFGMDLPRVLGADV